MTDCYLSHQCRHSLIHDALLSVLLLSFPKVEKLGKPTWKRPVEAVEDDAGGNNHALAQTIAEGHPGKPGNLIHQFAKSHGRASYLNTVLCLNLLTLMCLYR